MNFTVIDCIFGILILIIAFSALIKGFVEEVFGKAAWVFGLISGYLFYNVLSLTLQEKINSIIACNILAFLILFIIVFLSIKLIGMIIGKLFEISILKSLDRSLGFVFGCIEGFAIVCLIMFILINQPFFPVENLFEGSFFFSTFSNLMKSPEFKDVAQHV